MKLDRRTDILLHVIFPILLGCLIYFASAFTKVSPAIKNHIPDGLWAFSFISALLIIWERQVPIFWLAAIFSLAILYELAQGFHWISGTGDIADVSTYLLFFGLGILFNQPLKKIYSKQVS